MHDDDVITTADQLRRLVAAQFPHWAGLPVTPRSPSSAPRLAGCPVKLSRRRPDRRCAPFNADHGYTDLKEFQWVEGVVS